MQPSDHDLYVNGHIIPFPKRKPKSKGVTTTTIAALLAVTVLHDETVSAEEKLLELIEGTGEAEVMDSAEALDLLEEPQLIGDDVELATPANDN